MKSISRTAPGHIEPADIERLMEVAGDLFARGGFAGTGIRQIAEQSGVKASTIFYHFGTKAALYEEILDYKYQAVFTHVSQAIKPLGDASRKIEIIAGTLFDLLMRDRVFLMLLHRDMVDMVADRQRPALQEGYRKFFELTRSLLQAIFGSQLEKSTAFALVSVIVGYSEITAALSPVGSAAGSDVNHHADRRRELVELCRRIARMGASDA